MVCVEMEDVGDVMVTRQMPMLVRTRMIILLFMLCFFCSFLNYKLRFRLISAYAIVALMNDELNNSAAMMMNMVVVYYYAVERISYRLQIGRAHV